MITQERSFMNFLKFDKEYEYFGTEKLLEMFTQNELHQMKYYYQNPHKTIQRRS